MIMPFGKHKGEDISDIPRDYLDWVVGELEDEIDKKQKLLDEIEDVLAT